MNSTLSYEDYEEYTKEQLERMRQFAKVCDLWNQLIGAGSNKPMTESND